jgi:hypothetical protein
MQGMGGDLFWQSHSVYKELEMHQSLFGMASFVIFRL